MFESIIKQSQISTYDFRNSANPRDPLVYLFDDWVNYYKVKWAITNVLKPASILEIGIRFGYSAAAFLSGHPTARYVGIDFVTDTYGSEGAINWARNITRPFFTEFIIADTQVMNCLPGGIYDFIHIGRQQDGDGCLHNLDLAIKQAYYVLVDGYLWTQHNFMAVSSFLLQHADIIDFYGVIPGYAGELLIKVSPTYLMQVNEEKGHTIKSSLAIKQAYTKDYYVKDCGGFDAYKKYQGRKLEDLRLQAVAAIASLKTQGRVLDLGCGRGELTYYFAQKGFTVTAIDYSQSSIELAQQSFDSGDLPRSRVQFHCDNVCTAPLQGEYDLAIASDLIEHLSSEEVDSLYQRVARHLKTDGLFILHTFPNLWYYQYEYPRRRKIAISLGAYLPPQPRTRYEMLMHINEQSPRVLRRQLSKHFEHVLMWFGTPSNPGGSLVRIFSKQAMRAAPDLFAIASHQPLSQDQVKSCLQMNPLPPIPAEAIGLIATDYPAIVNANNEFKVTLEITNNSGFAFNSYSPNPVHISYHWMDDEATTKIIFGGVRTQILPPLNSTVKETYQVKIQAPKEEGNYVLRLTLVQELVRWFDQAPTKLGKDISIRVI